MEFLTVALLRLRMLNVYFVYMLLLKHQAALLLGLNPPASNEGKGSPEVQLYCKVAQLCDEHVRTLNSQVCSLIATTLTRFFSYQFNCQIYTYMSTGGLLAALCVLRATLSVHKAI